MNDCKIDDITTAAADGTFQETLPGLGYGDVTVMARAAEWDAADGVFLYGAWATLAFDHEPAAPPTVATLALANVTDANGNPMTSDPSIKGTLATGSGIRENSDSAAVGQLLDIEIDTNGDGVPTTAPRPISTATLWLTGRGG